MAEKAQRKWPRRIAITLIVLVLLYTMLGFWGVPLALRYIGLAKLNDSVPGWGEVEAFRFNPYTYQLRIEGFKGYTGDGEEAVSFRELRVDYDFWSLFGENHRFEEMYLGEPSLTLIILEDGTLNIQAGLENLQEEVETRLEEQAESKEPIEIPVIEVGILKVDDASVTSRIESLSDPFERNIHNLSFVMEDIRTSPEKRNEYTFTCKTLAGELIRVDGVIKLDPLSSDGTIKLDAVKLADFYKLTNQAFGFELTSGEVDFAANYVFNPVKEPRELYIRDGRFLLENFELRPRGVEQPFQTLERLQVEGINVFLFRGAVAVDSIDLVNGMLKVTRDKDGILSLLRYILPPEQQAAFEEKVAQEQAEDAAAVQETREFYFGLLADQQDIGLAFTSAWQQLQEMLEVTWDLKVGQLKVSNQDLILVDEVPSRPVSLTLGDIELLASDIHNQGTEPFPFSLGMIINETGKINAYGNFIAVPAGADFQYDISGINLAAFSPYIEAASPATLRSATLANKGSLKASFPDEQLPSVETKFNVTLADVDATVGEPLYPAEAPLNVKAARLHKTGRISAQVPPDSTPEIVSSVDIGVENFSLSRDASADAPVAWQKLDVTGVSASTVPLKASVEALTLDKLALVVTRRGDGSIDLMDFVPQQAEAAPEPAEEKESSGEAETPAVDMANFEIKQFTLKGGTVAVTDVTVTPKASFTLEEVDATVGPLKLTPDNVTKLASSMKLVAGGEGSIDVKGSARPLDPFAQTQATVTVEGVPMPGFSGYAVQAVGSPVASGTLNADLSYDIKTDALKGENKLKIGKLRFGERVPDSKAPNLPLEMGIAVLEDRSGSINLDVPVAGNLNDPKFNFANVIQGALSNIIEKVATSPFSLLGAAFGEGGEAPPSQVVFAAGSAELREASREPLTLVATAIYDRPSLALKLVPSIDPEKDVAFLRETFVEASIRKLMEEEGDDEGEAIEDLFDKAFPDGLPPKDDGTRVELTPGLMKNKLAEAQQVPDEALATLASQRAVVVKDYLLSQQELDAGRISISEPEGGFARDGAKVTFELAVAESG